MNIGDVKYAVHYPKAPESKQWYNAHAPHQMAKSPTLVESFERAENIVVTERLWYLGMLTPYDDGRPRNPSIDWVELEQNANWISTANIVTVTITETERRSV